MLASDTAVDTQKDGRGAGTKMPAGNTPTTSWKPKRRTDGREGVNLAETMKPKPQPTGSKARKRKTGHSTELWKETETGPPCAGRGAGVRTADTLKIGARSSETPSPRSSCHTCVWPHPALREKAEPEAIGTESKLRLAGHTLPKRRLSEGRVWGCEIPRAPSPSGLPECWP